MKYLFAVLIGLFCCLQLSAQHEYDHTEQITRNRIHTEEVYQFYIVHNKARDSFLLARNTYDSAFRPHSAQLFNKKEEQVNSIWWRYDAKGRKDAVADTTLSDSTFVMTIYIYDSAGHIAFERKYDTGGMSIELSYDYNSSGQRTAVRERHGGSQHKVLKKMMEYRTNGQLDREVMYHSWGDVEYRLLYVYNEQDKPYKVQYENFRWHEPIYEFEYNARNQVVVEKALVRAGYDDGMYRLIGEEGDMVVSFKYYPNGLVYERRVQFKRNLLHLERHYYRE